MFTILAGSFCLVNVFIRLQSVEAQTLNDVKTTYSSVTTSYNKHIRPSVDQTQATNVKIDYTITEILDYDELSEQLTTVGYLTMSWQDDDLTWTPGGSGVSSMYIPQDDVWKPDLVLRNSYETFPGLGSSYIFVTVTSTGAVTWRPFQVFESSCIFDVTYFPFDVHTCDLTFTSWSYQSSEISLQKLTSGIIVNSLRESSAWELKYPEASYSGNNAKFTFQLWRKWYFYSLYMVTPILLLAILNCFVFVLPTDSGERAGFSITVFLSLAVFLLIIGSIIPPNSDKYSLIGVYLTGILIMSTVVVLVSIIQVRLSNREAKEAVTWIYLWRVVWVVCKNIQMMINCKKCSCVLRQQVSPSDETATVNEISANDKQRNEPQSNLQVSKGKSASHGQGTGSGSATDVFDITDGNTTDKDESFQKYTWKSTMLAVDVFMFWLCFAYTFVFTTVILIIGKTAAVGY